MASNFICSFSGKKIPFVVLLFCDGIGCLRRWATGSGVDFGLKYKT